VFSTKGVEQRGRARIGLQQTGGDPLDYQFLLQCMAHIVQNPSERLQLAIVLQDRPQGSGADTFLNIIGDILGSHLYLNSSNVEDIVGTHAEGIEGKLLVVVNELEVADSTKHQSRFKDLITCPDVTVNPKGIRPYRVSVYAFFVFISNRANAINFDNNDNERRFSVFKPTAACCEGFTSESWSYFHNTLFKSSLFRRALYDELMRMDLREFDSARWRNMTLSLAYFRSSARNAPLHAKFFRHYVQELVSEIRASGFHVGNGNGNGKFIQGVSLASPQTCAPWELEGAPAIDRNWQVDQAIMHGEFQEFKDRTVGRTTGGRIEREYFLSAYPGIIHEKKSGTRKYVFNPRKLWNFLVEKKWLGQESFDYHRAKVAEARDRVNVDPRFRALAQASASDISALRPL